MFNVKNLVLEYKGTLPTPSPPHPFLNLHSTQTEDYPVQIVCRDLK